MVRFLLTLKYSNITWINKIQKIPMRGMSTKDPSFDHIAFKTCPVYTVKQEQTDIRTTLVSGTMEIKKQQPQHETSNTLGTFNEVEPNTFSLVVTIRTGCLDPNQTY